MLPIAVDAMGGDHAPSAIVAGAVRAARAGIPVCLVGDPERLRIGPGWPATLTVEPARDTIEMDERPIAVRARPDTSVRRTMAMVAAGRASAAVSCGHTGAILLAAVLELGTMDGVERPALATVLPRRDRGRLFLLDAGANVDCRPELLVSFARLGAAYACSEGVERPRIGLLSNGEEERKGNQQVRATLPLLRASGLHVVGPVEPTSALAGACDVVVCDGFVGNVFLKAAEGAVDTVVGLLREEILRYRTGRIGAFLLRGALRRFRRRAAWESTGGALLLGTRGTVVVGHGRARAPAVENAIRTAAQFARAGRLDALRHYLHR